MIQSNQRWAIEFKFVQSVWVYYKCECDKQLQLRILLGPALFVFQNMLGVPATRLGFLPGFQRPLFHLNFQFLKGTVLLEHLFQFCTLDVHETHDQAYVAIVWNVQIACMICSWGTTFF